MKEFCIMIYYFNPRSYKRSDNALETLSQRFGKFQSTLLQEERPAVVSGMFTVFIISIHAPTRGATSGDNVSGAGGKFQSTLLQEERRTCSTRFATSCGISIHAPTRGATRAEQSWGHIH